MNASPFLGVFLHSLGGFAAGITTLVVSTLVVGLGNYFAAVSR